MLRFAEPKPIQLRPYQADAVEALRGLIRTGRKRLLLVAGTGAGKTLTSAHILREAAAKGSYTLFIVDRVALVDQTSAVFEEYGIPHGVVQGSHAKWAPHENVQVCSAQTLARRSLPRAPDLIIVDEAHCFVPGTMVATPNGDIEIEKLQVGDPVYNAFGIGYVRHLFHNRTEKEIVRVTLEDGTQIECTADHRFFTGNAWVQARQLDGQGAVCIEDMPELWRRLSAAHFDDGEGELAGRTRGLLESPDVLLKELCKEVEEPHALGLGTGQNGFALEGNRAHAEEDWWQRSRDDLTAAGIAQCAWERMALGIRRERLEWDAGGGTSWALQDRHCGPGENARNRSGRREPSCESGSRAGQEEGRVPFFKRVARVESVERGRIRDVFNIEVSGHPSYFANGALVHNCQYRATIDFMRRYPEAVKVGLTATPFTAGMGEHWDEVVNVIPTRKLIEGGHLVEPKIYVARSPHDRELGLNSYGEFSDASATAAGIQIVGDVVEEWTAKTAEHFGGPVKTIVFSPTVEHGRELCAAFAAAGFNFQQISYLDRDDDARRLKIEEFRKPDSLIHGLVSCGVLTKGFDVPDVRVGISCKPYRKSLSSHMQEIGRIMRSHPGKEKALWLCLARDSKVLTNRGLIPIQFVTRYDKVWDGENFVSHGGAVCKGVRNVITYQGLTATPDHLVHTMDGWRTFGDCAREQIPITQTGFGGQTIRIGRDRFAGRALAWAKAETLDSCRLRVRGLWVSVSRLAQQFAEGAHQRLPDLQSACAGIPHVALLSGAGAETSLHQSEQPQVGSLRRAGDRVQIRRRKTGDTLDHGELGDTRGLQVSGLGSDRPGRTLRAGEHSVAAQAAEPAQSERQSSDCEDPPVSDCASRGALCGRDIKTTALVGDEFRGHCGEVLPEVGQAQREVWDILDAGPHNRFTCEGLLVHNCHSGNVERFALDMFDVWENGAGALSDATKRDSKPRERSETERQKVVCPECSGSLRGTTCMCCGWEKPARSGIHAVEGQLQEFRLPDAMQPREGLRADCLKEPRKVWEAALVYTVERSRKGEDHARRWAYGVWRDVYPSAKLGFGWFDMPIPRAVAPDAYALIDREVKRFRKGNRRAGA